MKTKNKKSKKGVKITRGFKIVKLIIKIMLIVLFFYVVIKRCNDVTGLSWFFTTWN